MDETIAVPNPLNGDPVLGVLPHGQKRISVVQGGLEVPNESGSDAAVIANGAVIVRLDL